MRLTPLPLFMAAALLLMGCQGAVPAPVPAPSLIAQLAMKAAAGETLVAPAIDWNGAKESDLPFTFTAEALSFHRPFREVLVAPRGFDLYVMADGDRYVARGALAAGYRLASHLGTWVNEHPVELEGLSEAHRLVVLKAVAKEKKLAVLEARAAMFQKIVDQADEEMKVPRQTLTKLRDLFVTKARFDRQLHEVRIEIAQLRAQLRAAERITGAQAAYTIAEAQPDVAVRFRVMGSAGDDTLMAIGDDGAGIELLGGDGHDLLYVDEGPSVLDGGAGDDVLFGSRHLDDLHGGPGNDRLFGRGGPDALAGDDGYDQLDGGGGDDILSPGGGADTVTGGDGSDVVTEPNGERLSDYQAGQDAADVSGWLEETVTQP